MAGPNSSFLDPLLSPTIQDTGTPKIRRANINYIGFTVADNPNTDATDITSGGGGGSTLALTDHNAFRALSSVADKTVIHFQSPIGTFVYSSSEGAGQADDDVTILKLTVTGGGSNGRAYSVDGPVLPSIAALRLAASGKQSIVNLQAYSSGGDGGGGVFYKQTVDAFHALPTDDGGVNIRVTGVSTFWYKRQHLGTGVLIDVRWFGAKGDFEWFSTGQDLTSGSALVPWRAFSFIDGATYIGKVIKVVYDSSAGIYSGTITGYNPSTHNWTVSPTPAHDATDQAQLYATDDTAAFQKACDYANQLTNVFNVLGYYLRSAKLQLQRATYYVPSTITGKPCGMVGDNATVKGAPGSTNLFVCNVDELTGKFNFQGIHFRDLHSVVKSWASTFNGAQADVVFMNCEFQNVDYALMNSRCGNLFSDFVACEFENSRVAKGFFATLNLVSPHGTSFGATPIDDFTPGANGTFTDGFILSGGVEGGVACHADVGSSICISGAGLSPLVDGGGMVDGQAWIISRRLIHLTVNNGSRFGGELAGMTLLRLEQETNPADGSADGSIVAIAAGTLATCSNFPTVQYVDAAPLYREIGASCEVGHFGAIGPAEGWTQAALDKFNNTTNWLEVALNRLGTVGNNNYAHLPYPPHGTTHASTPAFDVSRSHVPAERVGYTNGSVDTSGTIFDASSATGNTAGVGTDFGNDFNIIHIGGTKYYSNDGSHATGTLTKYFPESLAAGWYTAVLPYRTKGLGTSTCSFECHSGSVIPDGVVLSNTNGNIEHASYTWYHDGSATVHDHTLVLTFDIPNGGSTTNFIEFAAASLIPGRWGGEYLPLHGVSSPKWLLQGAVAWDPASLLTLTTTTTTVTVTGAKLGDRVNISFSLDLQGLMLTAYVSSADTVTAVLFNPTTGTVNLTSGVLIAETYR